MLIRMRGVKSTVIKSIDYTEKLYSCVDCEFFTLLLFDSSQAWRGESGRAEKEEKGDSSTRDLAGLTKVINGLVM